MYVFQLAVLVSAASDVSSRLGCLQIMIFGFLRFYHGYDPKHDPNHLIWYQLLQSDLVSTHKWPFQGLSDLDLVTSIWGIKRSLEEAGRKDFCWKNLTPFFLGGPAWRWVENGKVSFWLDINNIWTNKNDLETTLCPQKRETVNFLPHNLTKSG